MTLRKEIIKLAHANPELRVYLLPLVRNASEDEVEEKPTTSKGLGGNFIKFLEEEGDTKVTNPDTGNLVKIKSLSRGEKGKKYQKELFLKWKENQNKNPSTENPSRKTKSPKGYTP
jgi:hypothetical protein